MEWRQLYFLRYKRRKGVEVSLRLQLRYTACFMSGLYILMTSFYARVVGKSWASGLPKETTRTVKYE